MPTITRHSSPATRYLPLVLLVLLSMLTSLPIAAQSGRVEMQVTDPADKNVAGAKVTVTDASGTVIAEGETNKKGKLELSLKEAGTYEVTLEKDGLATRTVTVEITAGMTTAADIGLVDQAMAIKQQAIEAFNQAVADIEARNTTEALANFSKAADLDPTLADAHRLVAILESENGNLEPAGKALDQYLALVPTGLKNAAPAAYEIYRARGETAKLPEVRDHLRALGAHGDFAIRVYNEGVAALKEGNNAKAMELFTEATVLDPEMSTAYRSLAALHFNDKEYAKARPYLSKLLSSSPTHTEGHRLLFFSQYEMGELAEATKTATAWTKIDPEAASSILEQAELRFKGNLTDQAAALTGIVLEADPKNGPAHYSMGRILAQKGKISEAKTHLQKFLELSPNDPEAEAARQMLAGL